MNVELASPRSFSLPRLPATAWWLLVLLPANLAVLLDPVMRGFDGATSARALGRYLPAFLMLAVVGLAQLHRGPLGTRLRAELQLHLRAGLPLLVLSGLHRFTGFLVGDTGLQHADAGMVVLLVWPVSVATMCLPVTLAAEHGTLEQYGLDPRGTRALLEKFALSFFIVALATWQASEHRLPVSTFAFSVLTLATALAGPLAALLFKRLVPAMAVAMLAPAALSALGERLLGEPVGLALALAAGVAAVLALPWVLRRGLAAPAPLQDVTTERWSFFQRFFPLPFAVELRAQSDAMRLGLGGLVMGLLALALGAREELPMLMFLICSIAVAAGPGLAFAEARRTGTLELQLSSLPRARVLRRKLLASLVIPLASAVVPQMVLLAAVGERGSTVLGWGAAMLSAWSATVLVSTRVSRSVGEAVVGGLSLTLLTFFVTMMLFVVPWFFFDHSSQHQQSLIAASFVLPPLLALATGAYLFLTDARRPLRVFLGLFAAVLFNAAVFSAASLLAA